MTAPTFDETEEVVSELVRDYELWAGQLYMIRDKRNELVPLALNDVQKEVGRVEKEELEKNGNARLFILKARQGGISTDQQARSLHLVWSTPGATALTLAHNLDDTAKIFQITQRGRQNFPDAMLPKTGKSEAKEVTFPDLDSRFWTGTAGSTRVGRGITPTRLHGSEFAFWNNPRATLGQVSPAMIPIGSTIVLETTPDAFDSEAHKFWNESLRGETGYRCLFFPWWMCDKVFYRLPLIEPGELGELTQEEYLLCEQNGLDLEQIKWRRTKVKELGKATFQREYPEDSETCWITAGDKFYDTEAISTLLKRAPKPIRPPHKKIEVYSDRAIKTDRGIIYEDVIIGADTAEGGPANDRSTWVARAFPSWRLLSKFEDSKIQPDAFADLLVGWGTQQYGEPFFIVEKNFHGISVLRRMRDKWKYPRRSIYHRTPLATNFDSRTDYIGWTTTGESLPLMLDSGTEIIKAALEGFIPSPCRSCLIDMLGVVDGKLTGKDVLVAEILCWLGRVAHAKRKVSVLVPLHY